MADLVNTPQFKIPFQIANGKVLTVEQDEFEDRMQNAVVCLRYERGQRTAIPDFGLPDQSFKQGGANHMEIINSVLRWEPDVEPEVVASIISSVDGANDLTVEMVTKDESTKKRT